MQTPSFSTSGSTYSGVRQCLGAMHKTTLRPRYYLTTHAQGSRLRAARTWISRYVHAHKNIEWRKSIAADGVAAVSKTHVCTIAKIIIIGSIVCAEILGDRYL